MLVKFNKPTGLRFNRPTTIKGENFKYQAKTLKQGWYIANVPAGEYSINGFFKEDIPHDLAPFNLPQREKLNFKRYKLKMSCNPNVGSINHDTQIIKIDPRVINDDPLALSFVYLHEKGHKRYNTELFCDLYAARVLLNSGYNPDQIISACQNLRGQRDPQTIELKKYLQK
jgi:hypothetical protein